MTLHKNALAILLVLLGCVTLRGEENRTKPLDLFEQRIMPIFKSAKPSSCVQCHLASVDLKDYILPSSEATFASLHSQGLVDVKKPEESKILELIAMGDRDRDEKAKRIHEDMRKAEYEAFAAWIRACCEDPALVAASAKQVAAPKVPLEVIRHARKSRVVDSFVRKVWSQRMRCFPCHTPHELDENNPKHRNPIKKVKEFAVKYGEDYAKRLAIFKATPEETLQYLIEDSKNTSSDRLPLLNLESPRDSLLLLKPTAKLPERLPNKQFKKPSYLAPVSHMGGLKIHVDDPGYKSFVSFLEDYAKIAAGEYRDVASLPEDNWVPTTQFVMISETPEAWSPQHPVQMMIHAWDKKAKDWTEEPVAFTQNKTTPRGRIVAPLVLLRGEDQDAYFAFGPKKSVKLHSGRYLIKTYLDRAGKLKSDPTRLLGEDDFFGQLVIDADWGEGFPKREKLSGKSIVPGASGDSE